MWVEFKTTVQFESDGRHKGPVFEVGSRHNLAEDFANRWIRRGVAFAVSGDHEPPAEEKPKGDADPTQGDTSETEIPTTKARRGR